MNNVNDNVINNNNNNNNLHMISIDIVFIRGSLILLFEAIQW